MKKVVVIFGGISPEHDISIITGVLVLNSLKDSTYSPVPLYVDKLGNFFTGEKLGSLEFFKSFNEKKLKRVTLVPNSNFLYSLKGLKKLFLVDVAINCMHGGMGENGTIASLFALCGIPFVGENNLLSAISMDKFVTKVLMEGLKIKTAFGIKIGRKEYYQNPQKLIDKLLEKMDFPLIIKPNTLGSSIGIKLAKNIDELKSGLNLAFRFDTFVLVEKYITSPVLINCAVYKTQEKIVVSSLEKPITNHDILTFEDKYLDGAKIERKSEFPAKLDKNIQEKIVGYSKQIYQTLNFNSVIRIDYIVGDNEVYLNEINSVPGSLAYYLFCDTTKQFQTMLSEMINVALDRQKAENNCQKIVETSILNFKGVRLKK